MDFNSHRTSEFFFWKSGNNTNILSNWFWAVSLWGAHEGSRIPAYAPTVEVGGISGQLVSISAMTGNEKSYEELRWEDYKLGDKGGRNFAGQPTTLNGFSPFAAPNRTSNGFASVKGFDLFGVHTNKPPIQSTGLFHSTYPAFGQSTPTLGHYSTSSFGHSTPFKSTPSTTGGFGQSFAFGSSSPSISAWAPATALGVGSRLNLSNQHSTGSFQSTPFGQANSVFGPSTSLGQAPFSFLPSNQINNTSSSVMTMEHMVSNNSCPSLFSLSSPVAFAQTTASSPSILGATVSPAPSIFASAPATTSGVAFGQTTASSSSIFHQTVSPAPSIFASAPATTSGVAFAQTTASSPSILGATGSPAPSIFASASATTSGVAFGQTTASSPSIFHQTVSPALSIFVSAPATTSGVAFAQTTASSPSILGTTGSPVPSFFASAPTATSGVSSGFNLGNSQPAVLLEVTAAPLVHSSSAVEESISTSGQGTTAFFAQQNLFNNTTSSTFSFGEDLFSNNSKPSKFYKGIPVEFAETNLTYPELWDCFVNNLMWDMGKL